MNRYYYNSHFTGRETEVGKMKWAPKVTDGKWWSWDLNTSGWLQRHPKIFPWSPPCLYLKSKSGPYFLYLYFLIFLQLIIFTEHSQNFKDHLPPQPHHSGWCLWKCKSGGRCEGRCYREKNEEWDGALLTSNTTSGPKRFFILFSKISRKSKVRYQLYELGSVPHPFWTLFQICHMDRISGGMSLSPFPSFPAPWVRHRDREPCSVVLGRKGGRSTGLQERRKLASGMAGGVAEEQQFLPVISSPLGLWGVTTQFLGVTLESSVLWWALDRESKDLGTTHTSPLVTCLRASHSLLWALIFSAA